MRSSTFMPTLAYAPLSPMARTWRARILPSASQPILYDISIGWRLACMRKLSSRDSVHLTGTCNNQAASDAWAWLLMSSLPPKAPPLVTSSTVTCSFESPSRLAMSLRSSQMPWPPEYTCRRVPSCEGTAKVLSGSRNACSMR